MTHRNNVACGVALAALLLAGVAAAQPATVAILPPRVSGPAALRAEAELFCDRLAAALGRARGVRIISRQHLDKVLAEHKLSGRPVKAVLSFDVMVRVSVDALGRSPRLAVSAVDLSMGNLLHSSTHPWKGPADDAQLKAMAGVIAPAARAAASAPRPKLKVRVLRPVVADQAIRLEPLARKLETTFLQSLSRSKGVVIVHHLQAGDAREESLLLLAGLSRLPGGRRFAPQADATIEFRLREVGALGRTFEQTTVEASCRVARAGAGQWHNVRGRAREWNALTSRLWAAAAKVLAGLDPQAASVVLEEMARRRRQAEAEIDSYDDWERPPGPTRRRYSTDRLKLLVAAAAAAAKLDPTWERPAYLGFLFEYKLRRRLGPEATGKPDLHEAETTFREALKYLDRFRTAPGNRTNVIRIANSAGLSLLREAPPAKAKAFLDDFREFFDRALSEPARQQRFWDIYLSIDDLHEHMAAAGVPPAEAAQWLRTALERCEARLLEADRAGLVTNRPLTSQDNHLGIIHRSSAMDMLMRLRGQAIACAIDDGRTGDARKLVVDLMRRVRLRTSSPRAILCYDVAADTWYGPVKTGVDARSTDMPSRDGVWMRSGPTYHHVAAADIVGAAKEAKLVATTAEIRKRRRAAFDAAPPLDAAKFAIGLRRFEKAKAVLTGILADDPGNAEALLLMGFLHDRHCLNQYRTARAYYRRLAELDDPAAVLTGLHCQYVLEIDHGNSSEALPIGRRIVDEFKLNKVYRDRIIRQNAKLARQAGKVKP